MLLNRAGDKLSGNPRPPRLSPTTINNNIINLSAVCVLQFFGPFRYVNGGSRTNGGLLSKSWQEMSILPQTSGRQPIPAKSPPRIIIPQQMGFDQPSSQGTSTVGTPLDELVDRKELGDMHSAKVMSGDGRPRKRSIGDAYGS